MIGLQILTNAGLIFAVGVSHLTLNLCRYKHAQSTFFLLSVFNMDAICSS